MFPKVTLLSLSGNPKVINCTLSSLSLSLSLSPFLPPSLPLPLSLSLSIIPCVCIRARRIGGMPRITNHESVNLERESGVEQMNSRRGRRISQLLNLAEANASFVEKRTRKAGHYRSTSFLLRC